MSRPNPHSLPDNDNLKQLQSLLHFCLHHSFIHSGYFYSTSSSPLLLRGAGDYSIDTVSRFTWRSATGNYEWMIFPRSLRVGSNLWPSGHKAPNPPLSHHAYMSTSLANKHHFSHPGSLISLALMLKCFLSMVLTIFLCLLEKLWMTDGWFS